MGQRDANRQGKLRCLLWTFLITKLHEALHGLRILFPGIHDTHWPLASFDRSPAAKRESVIGPSMPSDTCDVLG